MPELRVPAPPFQEQMNVQEIPGTQVVKRIQKYCSFCVIDGSLSSQKNSEVEPRFLKHNGRGVLRGDIVKYDSGSFAVFTERGSSASQMTAAKVMDIISRLPGCAGQAADAVSAYTQEKWKMLTNYSKFQNRSVQTFGFVYHDTNGLNHGPVWKIRSFLLSGICTAIFWQDYYGKGNLRKSY